MKRKAGSKPAAAKAAPKKKARAPGRPRTAHAVAGRETIVAAARQLMDTGLPHQATIASIARKARVDPALVRYYFSSRDQLLLAVMEDIINSWGASHPVDAGEPAARLAANVGNMLDFARRVRSMQRLMIDECAGSSSPEVRLRVREINAGFVDSLARLLQPGKDAARAATDPLFLYVSIVGLCEFFAAAQAMILPLAPAGVDPEELAARYREFIIGLVLDGMRSRVEPDQAPAGTRLPAARGPRTAT
jgi:AcrR family transcriptional regulator